MLLRRQQSDAATDNIREPTTVERRPREQRSVCDRKKARESEKRNSQIEKKKNKQYLRISYKRKLAN
jgi:hypothetical protein